MCSLDSDTLSFLIFLQPARRPFSSTHFKEVCTARAAPAGLLEGTRLTSPGLPLLPRFFMALGLTGPERLAILEDERRAMAGAHGPEQKQQISDHRLHAGRRPPLSYCF